MALYLHSKAIFHLCVQRTLYENFCISLKIVSDCQYRSFYRDSQNCARSKLQNQSGVKYANSEKLSKILFTGFFNLSSLLFWDHLIPHLLSIWTSFWVLRTPKSWSKHFFSRFSTFFVKNNPKKTILRYPLRESTSFEE